MNNMHRLVEIVARPDSTDDWAGFDAGGTRLALYLITLLGEEAAPDADLPSQPWNGVTLAINLKERDQVQADARLVAQRSRPPEA